MTSDATDRPDFDARVEATCPRLSPAEARMARFFAANKETVVLSSAARIAEVAGTSDATVVRTARSLGYAGLAELREDILSELSGSASPARLLSRTLDETGSEPGRVIAHVVELHEAALVALRRPETTAAFARSLALIEAAGTRHVFGIGPSGALADYASLQFNRIGLRTRALTATGVALADRLAWIEPGDMLVMIAYAPSYREVEVALERAGEVGAPVVLVSDSLGPHLGSRVAEVLAVPRGRADHLATHGGTMALIEALTLGLAARDRERSIDALDAVSRLRGSLDRDWIRRGTRRPAGSRPATDFKTRSDEGDTP
jgi:DNA-binding MurR/RpiR family transcriptional regulator